MVEEGYKADILMLIRVSIDDWEGRLVNEQLAIGKGRGKINHYWMIKNVMGVLMEDMLGSWSSTCNNILLVKAKMINMDNQLNNLDATFAWKCLASGHRHIGTMEVGCGCTTGGRTMDIGSTHVHTVATNTSFPISSPIEPMFERVGDSEGPSSRMFPLPANILVTNTASNFEEGGWACPILEEVPPPKPSHVPSNNSTSFLVRTVISSLFVICCFFMCC